MDSPEIVEEVLKKKKNHKNSRQHSIFRFCFALAFSLLLFIVVSFSIIYGAVFVGNLSIWSPISLSSQCKIVSSSVDLRSSKVCELGLFNYKAKHVFYPFERKKYRCHYDYYWASVFKVEYIDHSGQSKVAYVEAPNEALPSNCRPNFGAAWLTKDKLKVNETYKCSYTLGISKVNINYEGLFDCQAEDPSTVEMIKRYYILFTRMLSNWNFSWRSLRWWRWDLIAGLLTGFITALLFIASGQIFTLMVAQICRYFSSRLLNTRPKTILLKRACFLVVYFSFMSWITIQYVKKLGFSSFI